MTQAQETGPEATAYKMSDGGTVTLGKTTFAVEIQDHLASGGRTVWLTGPRGGGYFLREYSNRSGLFQVIGFNSGQEFRYRGTAVNVIMLGDVIEVAGR